MNTQHFPLLAFKGLLIGLTEVWKVWICFLICRQFTAYCNIFYLFEIQELFRTLQIKWIICINLSTPSTFLTTQHDVNLPSSINLTLNTKGTSIQLSPGLNATSLMCTLQWRQLFSISFWAGPSQILSGSWRGVQAGGWKRTGHPLWSRGRPFSQHHMEEGKTPCTSYILPTCAQPVHWISCVRQLISRCFLLCYVTFTVFHWGTFISKITVCSGCSDFNCTVLYVIVAFLITF